MRAWLAGRRRVGARGIAAVAVVLTVAGPARGELPFEQEPINYLSARADDPVAKLQARVDRGEVSLAFDEAGQGYLKSVLAALGVSPTSQSLVFSKTSFQNPRISPRAPRALYFNDETYVGFVRDGDVLEFAAADPKLGAVFYVLEQQKAGRPRFERQTHACLQCHASGKTQDVPGFLMRSVYPSRSGLPVFNAGSFLTDDTSPLSERWGGWYVTGSHGGQRHLGNAVVKDAEHPERLDTEAGANRDDLSGLVDTSAYLADRSDVVALMVLGHQTQVHNLITLAGYHARLGRHYDEGINGALGQPPGTVSESTGRRISVYAGKLVRALLFCGEAKLTAPVEGNSGYAEWFATLGPRDGNGRSLRDFDLKTRMLRYPCSFLVYSAAFDGLPSPVKEEVYRQLKDVLTGGDTRPEFSHLSPTDRRSILEILLATKPGLPDDWKGAGAPSPSP
jgi:hypothetical protein